jgi:hypothetical protein
VTLEHTIEGLACSLLKSRGCLTPKMGTEGWPDRLVIWAPGHHFWIEFKRPGGTLTKAQRVRIPHLLKAGEEVHIVTSALQAVALLNGKRE